jgi:uncharacterized protein (DUF488 family)
LGTERTLWTVGHGARPFTQFAALLTDAGIEAIVDVRAYPQSRRNPQFAQAPLAAALRASGIGYVHERDLGGFREARPDSPHIAVAKFRGYADHMGTPAFAHALDRVLASAVVRPTAVMCAETSPDACHRRFLADAAHVRGWRVVHLLPGGEEREHVLHRRARAVDGLPRYDGVASSPQPSLFEA